MIYSVATQACYLRTDRATAEYVAPGHIPITMQTALESVARDNLDSPILLGETTSGNSGFSAVGGFTLSKLSNKITRTATTRTDEPTNVKKLVHASIQRSRKLEDSLFSIPKTVRYAIPKRGTQAAQASYLMITTDLRSDVFYAPVSTFAPDELRRKIKQLLIRRPDEHVLVLELMRNLGAVKAGWLANVLADLKRQPIKGLLLIGLNSNGRFESMWPRSSVPARRTSSAWQATSRFRRGTNDK